MRKILFAVITVLSLSSILACNMLVKNIFECRITATNITDQNLIIRHTAVQESGNVVTTVAVEAGQRLVDIFEPLTRSSQISSEEEKEFFDKKLIGLDPESVVLEILDTDMNLIVSWSGPEAYSLYPDGLWEEMMVVGISKEKTGKETHSSGHSKDLTITETLLSKE